MADAALEAILRRDRAVVIVSLCMLTILAWAYTAWLAADMDMGGMDMTGFRMIPAGLGWMMPVDTPWRPTEFATGFAMWAVMMIGMMTPSAAPMILLYAHVARSAARARKPFASAVWFAGGYFLAWTAFSGLATLTQWAVERLGFLAPDMALNSVMIGGVVLIVAGIYQWTPLKDVCLRQCQSPLRYIQQHGGFRPDAHGAVWLGLRHGIYCIGCCWTLMALLFVGGVMNLVWIAAIAILVLIEKALPVGRTISRVAGAGFLIAGARLLAPLIPSTWLN